MAMTGRERLTAVLAGQVPDHVPFAPLIGRYYVKSLPAMGWPLESIAPWEKAVHPVLKQGLNMHEVETARFLGADVFYRHAAACTTTYARPVIFFSEQKRGVTCNGFKTPRGVIWEEIRETEGAAGTEYVCRHMLQNEEDLAIYLDVLAAARPEPSYEDPRIMDEYVGDSGLITLTGPVTPLQELLQFRMGVEATTYALADTPDLMHTVLSSIQQLNRQIYSILAEAPAPVVITYEDTSTTVLSPRWYEEYCLGELDEYAGIIHGGGKLFIAHMCGRIQGLAAMIARGAMDGIDSVCPPFTGDFEPGEACLRIGKLIIGGLDPVFLVRATPEACREYAASKLQQIPSGRPYILSTGDSTAAGTPVANLRAISELVREMNS